MSTELDKIERDRVRAAEDDVIAGIPKWLCDRLEEAQREHEAKGGCPGCGHMVHAVHYAHCTINDYY